LQLSQSLVDGLFDRLGDVRIGKRLVVDRNSFIGRLVLFMASA
jgi:hypothetical protein